MLEIYIVIENDIPFCKVTFLRTQNQKRYMKTEKGFFLCCFSDLQYRKKSAMDVIKVNLVNSGSVSFLILQC